MYRVSYRIFGLGGETLCTSTKCGIGSIPSSEKNLRFGLTIDFSISNINILKLLGGGIPVSHPLYETLLIVIGSTLVKKTIQQMVKDGCDEVRVACKQPYNESPNEIPPPYESEIPPPYESEIPPPYESEIPPPNESAYFGAADLVSTLSWSTQKSPP